jgi:translocation and assembly module TamB
MALHDHPPGTTPHPTDRHKAAAPLATSLGLLLPLAVVCAFLLLVAGTGAAVLRWWAFDEAGSAWLVARLPLVEVKGFQGALLGDRWRADRVRVTWAGGEQWVLIEGLDGQGLRWAWRPHADAWVGLDMEQVHVRKLTLHTGQPGTQPPKAPGSLALPLQLNVSQVQVDELQVNQLPAVLQLQAQGLVLDAHPGGEHRVQSAVANWAGVHVEANARIGTRAPLPLAVQATLRPAAEGDGPRWAAVAQAQGVFDKFDLSATLRGVPLPGREPPSVDLRTAVMPLQAWPLAALDLSTRELDLAALSLRAPQTRLSGQARLAPHAKDTPLVAQLNLDNTLPGRWNEGRLPLKHLSAELRGDLRQPDRLEARGIDLQLSDARQAAGRVQGHALWQGNDLTLDTQWADLNPQRLDGRAAAMTLSGPVQVKLRGLRSPDPAATTAPPAALLTWKLGLEGRLDSAPYPVQLNMEGSANDQQLNVSTLRAQAGNTTAELKLLLQRAQRGDWKLESGGSLVNFDPVAWWPGDSGTAWRQGPHRLSGAWQFDVRLPGNVATLPAVELAQRIAGTGNLRIQDSLLAGVPLSADIKLGYTQAATPTTAQLRAALVLGGNQLSLEGRGDLVAGGQTDRWRAELKADNLVALAPLARLHAALSEWVPRQGTAQVVVAADGRWPAMRTEGNARITQLQMGKLAMAQGTATWRVDGSGDRPLSAKLDLAGLQWGLQRADHLRADLSGTLAEHRIDISSALPLMPPDAAMRLLGAQAQSGTRAQMLAQGTWQHEAGGGGTWRARIERLVVGSWDGSVGDSAPASVWAQGKDLRAELQFAPGGALATLRADAGRVQFGNQLNLRWDDVKLDLRGEQPLIQLHADIEPFALAPLLARAQPAVGWAGDITLAARVDIRAAEKFDADLVFERRDGDLHIAGREGMQLLGLTDLRLALSAHDGAWTFSQFFKGRSLGEISGEAKVQTTPERRWPHADAALSGQIEARVADIGIWGAWVPPGWRMAGELRTKAVLSGRFAEPLYTGELSGSGLSVRNLLQGVNVSDGDLLVRLQGDRAVVERFTLKGGEGTLKLTGSGTIGSAPTAHLQATADKFRALGRVDRLVIASGQASLDFGPELVKLDGRVVLDEAAFDASASDAPGLDDDVTVRRLGAAEEVVEDKKGAPSKRGWAMNLDIGLGEQTRFRGKGIETGLKGNLRLTTPGGRLDLRGTVSTDEGSYRAYGQKLGIERGIIAFNGPYDDPRLDILALRQNVDARVGLRITGTASQYRARLYSEPDMSETEKLSWLLLGRAPDGLGRNDTALLQRAAVALLSGEGEAPTDALMKNLGIDELGVGQRESGDVRETVITLGKQLSRRWYLGYERGVNATTGTWQLIYRIAQRFTVRAQSGLENSLDVLWTWRFQETPPDAAMRKSTAAPP